MVTYPYKAYLFKEKTFVDVSYVSYMKNYFVEYHRREDYEVIHNMKDGVLLQNTLITDNKNQQIYVKDYVKYNGEIYLVDFVFSDDGKGSRGNYYLFDTKKKPVISLLGAKKSRRQFEVVGNFYSTGNKEKK